MLAISFLFVTVQYYYQNWLNGTFSYDTLMDWVFVWNIPVVLVYGLIMEGAKMVPLVFWWYSGGKRLEVKTMITAGAVAGAAFGIFEAFYSHNQAFIQGWTWSAVSDGGVQALLPFWNQFWMIALNTALTAIVGYGLAKGKGWQFFLLASFLHAVMFYVTIFVAMGDITANQSGLILAVVSALLIAVALWLRWRNNQEETPPLLPVEPVMTVTPDGPSGTGAS
jgi:RsiW-degrading membrane proteinase PrsW (M82 family)